MKQQITGRDYVLLKAYEDNERALLDAEEMQKDPEMQELVEAEWHQAKAQREHLEHTLYLLLLPKDPHDKASIFLEIRAAAGGDESAIFA